LRTHAFGLIAAYYAAAAEDAGSPVDAPTGEFSDLVFQLLTDDVACVNETMVNVARTYRKMLADEGIRLIRTGSLGRIAQSFRANVVTSLFNFFNQPYSLQRSYIRSKYNLSSADTKKLCARLGRSRSEALSGARSLYAKRLASTEHDALEALSKEETPAALQKYEAAMAAKAATSGLADDDARIWNAFDVKFPLPVLTDGKDALAIWEAERALLPSTDEFSGLFTNYARMVAACRDASAGGLKCRLHGLCPTTGFKVDFVPLDKATLLLMLKEFKCGKHNASADLCAFLRANLRNNEEWGIHVMFCEKKLKPLFTNKHVIDGQLLTDGVRVIFPMRTHLASAAKAAAGQASGVARSKAGKLDLAVKYLDAEKATMYAAACVFMDDARGLKRKFPEEVAVVRANMTDLYAEAAAAKVETEKNAAKAKKEAFVAEKKRQREAMTEEEKGAERAAKVAAKTKKRDDPHAHIQSVPDGWYVTGVDIGHCNPVFAARKRVGAPEEEHPEFYKVTLGQWYTETGQRTRARLLQKKVKLAKLPPLPTLSASSDELWDALAFRARNYKLFCEVYGSVSIRRVAFDCYMKKQKMLARVSRKLVPDAKTVLAWGDGDFAHTRRGLATSVSGTIAHFIKERHKDKLRITPEHRTSMLCSCCEMKMKHVVHGFVMRQNGQRYRVRREPDGAFIRREIHGLYQCSLEGCYTRWDRDKNAAINIRNVFLSICTTRFPPLHFQRSFKME
jgi:hypothetical protein